MFSLNLAAQYCIKRRENSAKPKASQQLYGILNIPIVNIKAESKVGKINFNIWKQKYI